MTRRSLAVMLLIALAVPALFAQQTVPTPEEFLGYRLGENFTPYDRILDYFGELTKRSNLITVHTFGQTYERRPLVMAVVTSAKNQAAIDTIRANVAALAEAGTIDSVRGSEIAKTSPVIVWLAFGIHGNESSSAEAAMRVAATLLRDPQYAKVLEDSVVVIEPLQNPDGRERYIQWFHRTRGIDANTNPDSAEHYEPWPGGRYNHYMIDMNRDMTWMSQRETQARVALHRDWWPQVFVDLHEMSWTSSYFFPPDAAPLNLNMPSDITKWLEVFGRANAAEFTKRGWPFFVGERFDRFYPGYRDSWPSLRGGIGMTYEVAGGGRGGSAIEREDSTTLTLADRIDQHSTTALATVRTAAANREALLRYSWDSARKALEEGRNTYLILPGSPNFTRLADTLQKQGVRVQMLGAPITMRAIRVDREAAESHTFPAGTAVVSTRQALGGLAQTLLERNAAMPQTFVDEQRAKAAADEPDDFYDLTVWSMPVAMNVETWVTSSAINAQLVPWTEPPVGAVSPAQYAYLVSGNDPNVYRFAGQLIRRSVRFNVSDAELNLGDRTYPRGSIVILKGNNNAELVNTLSAAAKETNTTVVALAEGWMGATTFGSEKLHYVREPKIALVGGPGTGATSFGMLWHTLDVDTPVPHTVIWADSIRNLDLARYNVIILPDGDYVDRIGKRGTEKLQAWVRGGGTLVAIKGATAYLHDKDVALSKLKPWEAEKKEGEKKDSDKKDEEPVTDRYNEYRVPGSAFRTTMNERSYLTFGVPRSPAVLVEGSAAFQQLPRKVDNVITIEKEDPLLAGIAWTESLDRLKGSPYVVNESVGRGTIVTFADEPHFRLFWRGTLPVFMNAVIYSPSFLR
ncbi:MAG: hypothetical protein JJE51_08725 [Thermoanaerobaculia bacterium]|nr:hypothetical protein [Thermoanaerobaculia bacterium]